MILWYNSITINLVIYMKNINKYCVYAVLSLIIFVSTVSISFASDQVEPVKNTDIYLDWNGKKVSVDEIIKMLISLDLVNIDKVDQVNIVLNS